MALPYPTKVILPFDIATAQDMNERHANDVALANGSGLDDNSIPGSKIATYRLPYQTDNANAISDTTGTTIKLQAGWGQMIGVAAVTMSEAVTFPDAFTTVLGVIITPVGISGNDSIPGSSITDFETPFGVFPATTMPTGISNSGFTVHYTIESGNNFNPTRYYAYSWIAWGIA